MAITLTAPASQNTAPVYRRKPVVKLLIIALLAEIGYAVLNISTMQVYLRADPGSHPGFIANGRGLGESVIGFVLVAFLLSEAVFKSPMGSLADRYGPKRLMIVGPALTVFTPLLTLLIPLHSGAWEVLALILLRVLDGIGAAMLWPAMFSLMGNSVEDDQRQQAMSMLNLCYMLGIALALPIGGIVNDLAGVKWASFFLASVLFAGVAIAVIRFVPDAHIAAHHDSEESIGFTDLIRSIKVIPGYLGLAIVTFAGIGFPMAIIKIFAQDEYAMSESKFGGLVFPAAIAMAAFSVPLCRYGEKVGKAKAVHTGMLLCALGLAIISTGAFVPELRMPWVLALGSIPVGIGFLLAIPAWMASVSDIDPTRRGANLGAVMTAQGIGAIIGAPIGSTLYEKFRVFGPDVAHYSPFVGCAACVTAGWLLSLKILHDPKP